MLGGITQQRVSQLVRDGVLVADRDENGQLQYDRASAEAEARARAVRRSRSAEDAETRKMLHDEARERIRRQRANKAAEAEARARALDDLRERSVRALEGIYECLRRAR